MDPLKDMLENSLKNISDATLLKTLKDKVLQERKITEEILNYLNEVEVRRLYAQRGYPSLFEFCIKELGYSESSTQRRISAMRLSRALPEVKEKIKSGVVNLSTLNQLQGFCRREEKLRGVKIKPEERRELLSQIENKSQRECEKIFLEISPEVTRAKEGLRPLGSNLTEIKFFADKGLCQRLYRLRDSLSHKNKDQTLCGFIEVLVEIAEREVSKRTSAAKVKKTVTEAQAEEVRETQAAKEVEVAKMGGPVVKDTVPTNSHHIPKNPHHVPINSRHIPTNSRYIPINLRRQVHLRDHGRCQFKDPLTQRTCNSSFKLEIDHFWPLSLGGKTELTNLRLLCSTHNKLEAIRKLGPQVMGTYLRK